jgi:hypothetical protein
MTSLETRYFVRAATPEQLRLRLVEEIQQRIAAVGADRLTGRSARGVLLYGPEH